MRFRADKSPLTSKEQAFELGRKTSESRISRGARWSDLEFNIEMENLHYELSGFVKAGSAVTGRDFSPLTGAKPRRRR
jgi:hypothetical protein